MSEYEKLEELPDKNNVRELYDKKLRLSEDFNTGGYLYKNPNGILVIIQYLEETLL